MGFVHQTEWPQKAAEYKNPEHLTRRVKIRRVGCGFFIDGRVVQPGEIVTTDATTAADLVCFGRAVLVE